MSNLINQIFLLIVYAYPFIIVFLHALCVRDVTDSELYFFILARFLVNC